MSSSNAGRVADKVLETMGKREKVNFGNIAREVGYAETTARNPQQIRESKAYKEVTEPVVTQMERERQRIMTELSIKDLSNERHRDLVSSMDTLTKNIQLLSGKETERTGVVINVVSYGDNSPVSVPATPISDTAIESAG